MVKARTHEKRCVICTALPLEIVAVRSFLIDIHHKTSRSGNVFDLGSFPCQRGNWQVLIAETGAGNIPAALSTQEAIQHFDPQIVLFVGVAGGMKDVKIGDVVIGTKVYEYQRGKLTMAGFHPRPATHLGAFRLLEQAKAVRRDDRWQNRIRPTPSKKPRAFLGAIAAGEAVIASRAGDLFDMLQENYSDALAVEMEGSGFLGATYVTRYDGLVIRGISDLIVGKADADAGGSQESAAIHASAFGFELLEQVTACEEDFSYSNTGSRKRSPKARKQRIVDSARTEIPAGYVTTGSATGSVTGVRKVVDEARVESLIRKNDWIVGAVNFDEDLHFSSFYTRQSCAPYQIGRNAAYGYESLVALYEDFRETYYIPHSECVRVAQAILDRILKAPVWMEEILGEINKRSRELEGVFADDEKPFKELTNKKLLALYERHNRTHARLYEVARLPEAMDRGVALYTNYLKDYLRRRGALLANSPKELNRVFEILTVPEEMSVVQREIGEFHELLISIKESTKGVSLASGSVRRAWLKMPPDFRGRIEQHSKKWGCLGYHGYGTRTLADVDQYLHRIAASLNKSVDELWTISDYSKVLAEGEVRRVAEFTRYRIDETHQMLFRLHSRIGIAKLFRRYVQLRNFTYLDQMLSEISARLECPEGSVRCLLPEEVQLLLARGESPSPVLQGRAEFAVHVIDRDAEGILGGREFRWIRDQLAAKIKATAASSTKLEGSPAFTGVARGRCKVIFRPSDGERVGFKAGDILVSEATDPDLVPMIEIAAGVVTEQGGVTSHAAIICRELRKPALVGVKDLLAVVREDDYAVLNAEDGFLSIIRWDKRKWTIPDTQVKDVPTERIGAKAANLGLMISCGIKVPRFFVIPLDIVGGEFSTAVKDATGEAWESFRNEVAASLDYLNGNLFVVRQSMPLEDSPERSYAGQFETESHVERRDIVGQLVKQLLTQSGLTSSQRCGCLIVQEMVLGDVSGVCFTRSIRSKDADHMLVEVVPGGNDALTAGKVVPARYFIDRENLMVARDESLQPWHALAAPDLWRDLGSAFLQVERAFGAPQDIEWTVKGNEIWILQARPITAYLSESSDASLNLYRPRRASDSRDIASIYAAYRIPPNLRLHMLRVAAVASLIVEKWSGPTVEYGTIVSTSLLHDIGNIVKANYDAFPTLFPEEMQDLEYWKAVQENVRIRYGKSDQEVTLNIARELRVSDRVLLLLSEKTFVKNESTAASDDWELKICAYADQRVCPTGVTSLLDRLAEAKERYRGVPYASVNDSRFKILSECALTIESQISSHLSLRKEEITDAATQPHLDQLRAFVIEPSSNIETELDK